MWVSLGWFCVKVSARDSTALWSTGAETPVFKRNQVGRANRTATVARAPGPSPASASGAGLPELFDDLGAVLSLRLGA